MSTDPTLPNAPLDATFSALLMSIASSAAMSLGLAPQPHSQEVTKDKALARFNIDLLLVLKEKSIGNLTTDEQRLLEALLSDLQMKYISL